MTRVTVLVAAAVVLAGCASNEPRRGPRTAQPADVVPTQIVASVGPFDDTNANGYPDSATISLYVFSDAYPDASVMVPASLTFRLKGKDGAVIREWAYTAEQAAGLVRRGPVGLGYVVRLSLLETSGGDELPVTRADLSVTYATPSGVTLTSVPEPVRVGRVSRPQ